MARKSRRAKKSSRRNLYLSVAVLVLLVVSVVGFYAYENRGSSSTTSSSQSSSGSSSSASPAYAVLDTSQGTIVIELFPQVAPQTVANFENLANQGFYNDLVWHRIVQGFVIQTGDPNTKGAVNSTRDTWGEGEGPTTVPLETNANYPNDVGYVALAHTSSSTSGGSEFYINLANNTSLNGSYTVFGKVVSGMSVVEAIAALPVYTNQSTFTYDQPTNAQNALLISITIQSTP
jgi:cyclophilin family peptidyl-prolyl cis-trans isomerase